MSTIIETPEAMAARLFVRPLGSGMKDVTGHDEGIRAIRARDEQIAALCDEMAAKGKRGAPALPHSGLSVAFAAVAAMLRGAR